MMNFGNNKKKQSQIYNLISMKIKVLFPLKSQMKFPQSIIPESLSQIKKIIFPIKFIQSKNTCLKIERESKYEPQI
jgi:hypothetical protein